MTIEHYKNFMTIVECGNILAASQNLKIAQPALSNQLKTMEKEYGTQLLIRGGRHIEMTEAGRILYQKAKTILSIDASAKKEITESVSGMAGTLSIALPPTNTMPFLVNVFQNYIQKYPTVHLDIHELSTQESALAVLDGVVEAAVVCAPIANPHLFHIHLLEQELIQAVIPQNHILASRERLRFKEMQNIPFVIPRGCISIVESLASKHGFTPRIDAVTTSRNTAFELARIQESVAIIPVSKFDTIEDGFMIAKSFAEKELSSARNLIVAKNHTPSILLSHFLEVAHIEKTDDIR